MRMQGQLDTTLSEQGHKQARLAAEAAQRKVPSLAGALRAVEAQAMQAALLTAALKLLPLVLMVLPGALAGKKRRNVRAAGGLEVLAMTDVPTSLVQALSVSPAVELLDPSAPNPMLRYFIALGFGLIAPILPQFTASFGVSMVAAGAVVSKRSSNSSAVR